MLLLPSSNVILYILEEGNIESFVTSIFHLFSSFSSTLKVISSAVFPYPSGAFKHLTVYVPLAKEITFSVSFFPLMVAIFFAS